MCRMLSGRLFPGFVVVFGCVAVALQGCGEPEDDRIIIRMLAMEYDPGIPDLTRGMAAKFMELNPDIKVEIEVSPWEQGRGKLLGYLSARKLPDIANITTTWLPEFSGELHALEPLDAYMSDRFREGFHSNLLAYARMDGQSVFGLPYAVSVRALYYRKDILDAKGLKPPTNWDELVQVARAVHDPGGKPYAFAVQGREKETMQYWLYFFWAAGGQLFGPPPDSRCLVNSAAGVEALTFEADLLHKHKVLVPNPTMYNREDYQDMYKQERLALFITGAWFEKHLARDKPDLLNRTGIVAIPGHHKKVTPGVTDSLVIFKASKHKEAAWKFMEFLFSDENRLAFNEHTGMVPGRKSVTEKWVKTSPQRRVFAELVPQARLLPLNADFNIVNGRMVSTIQAVLIGDQQPLAALNEAVKDIEAKRKLK